MYRYRRGGEIKYLQQCNVEGGSDMNPGHSGQTHGGRLSVFGKASCTSAGYFGFLRVSTLLWTINRVGPLSVSS